MAQIRRLNTLRGAAALIVVVSHFSNATGAWGKLLGQGAGQLGVMLFFMLSGFLMSHLYWRREPSNRNLLRFFEARVARVLPLYIAVVLLSFFSGWPYDIATGPALASHLLFLSGVSVLWTIPPEIQFYVLFGLAWRFLGRRSGAVLASMAVIFVGLYFLNFPSGKVEVLGLTVSAVLLKALPYFMVGALLGYAYQPLLPRLQGRRHAYLLSAIVVLLLFPNIFYLRANRRQASQHVARRGRADADVLGFLRPGLHDARRQSHPGKRTGGFLRQDFLLALFAAPARDGLCAGARTAARPGAAARLGHRPGHGCGLPELSPGRRSGAAGAAWAIYGPGRQCR